MADYNQSINMQIIIVEILVMCVVDFYRMHAFTVYDIMSDSD